MMPSFDTLQASDWRRQALFFAATAVATISIVTYFVTQREPDQPISDAKPAATVRHASDVFGPGRWVGNATSTWRTPPQTSDTEEKLGVDDRQQLLVNSALLEVINHYLIEQAGDHDADDLKDYLKEKLPPAAYAQVVQIVDRYQAYMQQHDEFLAVQNLKKIDVKVNPQANAQVNLQALSNTDFKRIAEWAVQRNRLRQNLLGADVTQAWYENDEASLKQALDELQQRNNDANSQSPASEAQPALSPVPHWADKREEERHVQRLLALLHNATTSFSELKPVPHS